jgi:hypothetical protein
MTPRIRSRSRGIAAAALTALALPVAGGAQTPSVFSACVTPLTGLLYVPKEAGKCFLPSHVVIGWTDGAGAFRSSTTLGGDLSGTLPNPIVAKLRGTELAATAPTNGQVLTFTGGKWTPATPTTGGANGAAGGVLTGTYPNPSLAIGAVTTASIADAAVTTSKLAEGAVAAALGSAPSGQVLTSNGTTWAAAEPAASLQSPNGRYHLRITDSGIELNGPNDRLNLTDTGIELTDGVGNTVRIDGGGIQLTTASASVRLQTGGAASLNGTLVTLGCSPTATSGVPVARVGDQVIGNGIIGTILTAPGSQGVLINGITGTIVPSPGSQNVLIC